MTNFYSDDLVINVTPDDGPPRFVDTAYTMSSAQPVMYCYGPTGEWGWSLNWAGIGKIGCSRKMHKTHDLARRSLNRLIKKTEARLASEGWDG